MAATGALEPAPPPVETVDDCRKENDKTILPGDRDIGSLCFFRPLELGLQDIPRSKRRIFSPGPENTPCRGRRD